MPHFAIVIALLFLSVASPVQAGLTIEPGQLYATSGMAITQYDARGERLAMMAITEGELRGIAVFGGDRLLVVQSRFPPALSRLLTIAPGEGIIDSREFSGSTAGNISLGKIHVTRDGAILVATGSAVLRLATPSAPPEVFLPGGFDVAELPDGTLVVAEDYALAHYAPDGTLLGRQGATLSPTGARQTLFTNLRGVHWSDSHQRLYATMLGSSGDFFRLIAMTAEFVEQQKVSHAYADDIAEGMDAQLVVGSRTLAPTYYDSELRLLRSVAGQAAQFVAVHRLPGPIMANGFEATP